VPPKGPQPQHRWSFRDIQITRGALVLFLLEVGFSIVYMTLGKQKQLELGDVLLATPTSVFRQGHVWTLVTSSLIQPSFIGLLMHGFVFFSFLPTLERFWGTSRFIRFVVVTQLAGQVAAVAVGFALGHDGAIVSLNPFMYAAIVAFGIVYAKQPVQFFGVLPLTGKQLMWGFIVFLTIATVLQGIWEDGAANAAAMGAAALMVSKLSPGLALKRWKIRRARAQLTVIQGGAARPAKRPGDEQKYLN